MADCNWKSFQVIMMRDKDISERDGTSGERNAHCMFWR